MSNSTLAQIRAKVRKTIPEASAVDWQNADLDGYINDAYFQWAAELGKLPGPGWFTIEALFTVAANTATYAMTGLVGASVGTFAALKDVWYLPTSGDPILVPTAAPGTEDRYRVPVGSSAVGQIAPEAKWVTRPSGAPTLNLHQVSSEARNYRAYVRYQPVLLEDDADELQTDPRHDDVIVRGAVLRALEDAGETDPVIERRFEADKVRFIEDESNAAGEFDVTTTKMTGLSDAMFG